MDIESIREYCLSLPYATEDMRFGPAYLCFAVFDKIFACYGFERDNYFVVKTDPDYAIELRDRYSEIEPAWHWNKRYWNQLDMRGSLTADMFTHLIRHSYSEVVKKLPKRLANEHPEILTIS